MIERFFVLGRVRNLSYNERYSLFYIKEIQYYKA